jgi:hypothetical protein
MKKIITVLILSLSFPLLAEVDYVAVGKIYNQNKYAIQELKETVECLVEDFDKDRSCQNIEMISENFNIVLKKGIDSVHSSCGSAKNFHYINYKYTKELRELTAKAEKSDAVLAIVEKLEASTNLFKKEVSELIRKLKLQEKYTSSCLFNLPLSTESIFDQICN